MSNKHDGYIVVLRESVSEEQSQKIMDAIQMITGVLSIEAHKEDINSLIVNSRAKASLLDKYLEWYGNN